MTDTPKDYTELVELLKDLGVPWPAEVLEDMGRYGLMVVPVEPTREMMNFLVYYEGDTHRELRDTYTAMLVRGSPYRKRN